MHDQNYIDMALTDNKELKLILKGEVIPENDEKIGVISVVFITTDVNTAKVTFEKLNQYKNKDDYYMLYSCPTDTQLTELAHYPSLQITKADLL